MDVEKGINEPEGSGWNRYARAYYYWDAIAVWGLARDGSGLNLSAHMARNGYDSVATRAVAIACTDLGFHVTVDLGLIFVHARCEASAEDVIDLAWALYEGLFDTCVLTRAADLYADARVRVALAYLGSWYDPLVIEDIVREDFGDFEGLELGVISLELRAYTDAFNPSAELRALATALNRSVRPDAREALHAEIVGITGSSFVPSLRVLRGEQFTAMRFT